MGSSVVLRSIQSNQQVKQGSSVNNFVVNFQVESRGKLQVSLLMLKVHRNFKTSRTLSSTTWHLTSTMLRFS